MFFFYTDGLRDAYAAASRARTDAKLFRDELAFEERLRSVSDDAWLQYTKIREAAKQQRAQEEREDRRLALRERETAVREREVKLLEQLLTEKA